MGGLRALCCSKGDRHNDDQDTPPTRPTQRQSEKETQKTPGNVKGDDSLVDVKQNQSGPRDLWKEAYDQLDADAKKYLRGNRIPATDAINEVIKDTETKRDHWEKGGLRIKRENGDDISLRESADKIIGAATKAKDVISTIVSFDPTGHASSAWTVISFGMSIVQNSVDRREAIFAASENQGVGSDKPIDKVLLEVYSAILVFTAEVKKGQDESALARAGQSVFALIGQPLGDMKAVIEEKKVTAQQWINLAANLAAEEQQQLAWISTAACSSRQRELQEKRTAGTGTCLLESEEYIRWKNDSGDLLLLPGISGCGKSVLCSTVVKEIEETCKADHSKYLAYWYFQFGDEKTQTVNVVTRSLIRQLCRSPLLPSVTKMWKDYSPQFSQPDSEAIMDVLDDVISSIKGKVYLVFDALDESGENARSKQRQSFLSVLTGLLERHKDKVHILVTSRPERDIEKALGDVSKIDLEARLAEDVKSYVCETIAKDPNLSEWALETQDLIKEKLLISDERRFRWAELQLAELRDCLSEDDIETALNEIPPTLEETYLKVLEKVQPKNRTRVREILIIVCLSPDALTLHTVAAIMGIKIPKLILELCTSSLLSSFEDLVRIAHFSVKEYLIIPEKGGQHHECQFTAIEGHKFLANKALDCLLGQTHIMTMPEACSNIAFLCAAATWNFHVAALGDIDRLFPDLQDKISRIFTQPIVFFNWVRALDDNLSFWEHGIPASSISEYKQPVCQASEMGLLQIVKQFLSQGVDPDASGQGYYSSTALQAASSEGHKEVVQVLLESGANVNAKEGILDSPLYEAASNRHGEIVHMLFEKGAEIDTKEGIADTSALYDASSNGDEKLVKLLLQLGADINAQGNETGGALFVASYYGHEKVVRTLLDNNANVNGPGREYGSVLQGVMDKWRSSILAENQIAARGESTSGIGGPSSKTYAKIAQLLLERGVNVNVRGEDFSFTELQVASFAGHDRVVQLLLERGADVNAQGESPSIMSTPLYEAAVYGHENIARMLLNEGANTFTQIGRLDTTALQEASSHGFDNIVQMLLDGDPDIKAHSAELGDALAAALSNGHSGVVQKLIDHGADVNADGVLKAGSEGGHEETVKMLLHRGADANASGALQAASAGGHERIVEMLLDHGANVDAQDELFQATALHTAVLQGREGIVKILLKRGADVNIRNELFGSALDVAVSQGHERISQILRDGNGK